MPDEPLSLQQLYAAIEAHIQAAVPGLKYIATMPAPFRHIPLPAILLEVDEFEPGQDRGTGEVTVVVRFTARVVVGAEQPDAQHQAAFVAALLTGLLRQQSWGLDVEFAEFVRASQDWTRPDLDAYVVWAVEWTQPIYLGDIEWPWPDQPPGSLVLRVGPQGAEVPLEEVQPEDLQ